MNPIDSFAKSRLLYAGPWTTSGRSNGSILISNDGGKSWPHRKTIVPGGFAYSQLVVLDPREDAGLLYEAENYSKIVFMRLSLQYMTDGKESNDEAKPCAVETCPADPNDSGAGDGGDGGDVGLLIASWGVRNE
jgi:hypothetical protein